MWTRCLNHRVLSGVAFIAILVSWILTWQVGEPDVASHVKTMLAPPPQSVELAGDPHFDLDVKSPDAPWHFIGNTSSPCPFVVGVDWSVYVGPLCGTGGRSYFLWFFGYKYHLPHLDSYYWMS